MFLKNIFWLTFTLWGNHGSPQEIHFNAHAHNDYEHARPLFDALKNGFMSVEADVHLRGGQLVVAHNFSSKKSPLFEELYIKPLDSIMNVLDGCIYPCSIQKDRVFYLMIDIKTGAEETSLAIKKLLQQYPSLGNKKTIRIFLSGNRNINELMNQDFFIGADGRPTDLGKGYPASLMPVISDHFKNWSGWNGKSIPTDKDLAEMKVLAMRVHAEKKLLRLWSIPDNELAWQTLLEVGVDLINTDHLEELGRFLTSKGL